MGARPDFVVRSSDRKLQLVVEVKALAESGVEWATRFRRNLLAHGALPPAPYFLLVLPERLYLWSDDPSGSAPPRFAADTREVLDRYFPLGDTGEPGPPLSERGLEFAVESWLRDLANPETGEIGSGPGDWLHASGLADRIKPGDVEVEPSL